VTTLGGVALVYGSTDGFGQAALFNYPRGVDMDAAGTIAIVVSGCAYVLLAPSLITPEVAIWTQRQYRYLTQLIFLLALLHACAG
jgi:hypothetical protein